MLSHQERLDADREAKTGASAPSARDNRVANNVVNRNDQEDDGNRVLLDESIADYAQRVIAPGLDLDSTIREVLGIAQSVESDKVKNEDVESFKKRWEQVPSPGVSGSGFLPGKKDDKDGKDEKGGKGGKDDADFKAFECWLVLWLIGLERRGWADSGGGDAPDAPVHARGPRYPASAFLRM